MAANKMRIEDKIQEVIEFLATLDARSLERVFEALPNDPTSKFWEAIKDWR